MPVKTFRIILLSASLVCLLPAWAQNDGGAGFGGLTVKRFKYQGDGYLIAGQEAVTKGNKVTIERAQAHLFQENDVIKIFTPHVVFDRKTQRGSSDAKVQVRSKTFTMEGIGFDADFKRGRIRLRKNVKITIYDSSVNLLETIPNKK